jgi:hypothetical protein
MASGLRWEDYVERAVACPAEFPFGTLFVIDSQVWTCLDRGGAIVRWADGSIWLDELTPKAKMPYGNLVDVEVKMK